VRASRNMRNQQQRATYARTGLDFLVNSPDGFPSDYPPGWPPDAPLWWNGLDSGGGAYPIGPNGPYATATGGVPAVIRATALITGPITSAPFRAMAGTQQAVEPRWLTDPMLLRPDARYPAPPLSEVTQLPRSLFWAEWLRSAIWWGVGAFICREDGQGQPLPGTLYNIDARQLSTERDSGGALHWVYSNSDSERLVFDRDGYFPADSDAPFRYRIVVLRNPHSAVDMEGCSLGVFAMSPSVFGLAAQIDSYSQGTFRTGVPAGYLKVNTPGLTQPAATELKQRWMAAHGGDRRSVAVLNATTDFQPLNLSPVDAALDSVKRLNLADVAFAFALDPMTLGAGLQNSATYTNLRDAWANHRDFGLAPWTAAVEDTLSALMPGTQSVRVNLDGFANPTPAERFTAWQTALTAGIVTVDEVRAAEGLPPLPGTATAPPTTTPQEGAPDEPV
jgi:HK97 family phage portal protein